MYFRMARFINTVLIVGGCTGIVVSLGLAENREATLALSFVTAVGGLVSYAVTEILRDLIEKV